MTDYYKTLGVLDSAEIDDIRVAYKKLLMKYHPDRNPLDIDFATKKTQEITKAYDVLSDIDKRYTYDQERCVHSNQSDKNTSNSSFNDVLNRRWDIAIEDVNGLEDIYEELNKISPEVSLSFKAKLLQSMAFDKAEELADDLTKEYLIKYFGSNKKVNRFVLWLLINGRRDIAKEVNKSVVTLGEGLDVDLLVKNLDDKNNLNYIKSQMAFKDGGGWGSESEVNFEVIFGGIVLYLLIFILFHADDIYRIIKDFIDILAKGISG
jgi:curved DNA-binding protein CbpA